MKIAFFHELASGGAKRTVNEFAKRLAKNHRVDVYAVGSDTGFSYHFIAKNWVGRDWRTRLYKDTIELGKLCLLHRKIAKIIDGKAYDFVFVHPSQFTQAPFLMRFLHTTTVYYCQEPLRIVYDRFASDVSHLPLGKRIYENVNRSIRKWIDRVNLAHATYIVANSKFSQKLIRKAYGRNAILCYLGVDTNVFRPLNLQKTVDVLFVGEKLGIKGYDLFTASLKLFIKAPIVKVVSKGKSVGVTSDEELAKAYNSAKVVAVLGRNEPFGLVALEAMACGVPVVALSEGGFMESVQDRTTGFLVKPNAYDIFIALKRILENETLRSQLGKEARMHVLANWTWEKTIMTFQQITEQWLHTR